MNILVTGGAGYIGSVLTKNLLIRGHNVTVVDNFRHGYHGISSLVLYPELEVIKRNILDPNRDYLKDKDFIFHLAALTSNKDCEDNKLEAFKINTTATDNIAYEACTIPMLYTSTTAIYGDNEGAFIDENTRFASRTKGVYSRSKLAGERLIEKYDNAIILRLATIYGVSPLMRPHSIVNDFVRMAVQEKSIVVYDKDTIRPYMHILNCVDGLLFAMQNKDKLIGKTYNFVGHNAYKYEIAKRIHRHIEYDFFTSNHSDIYKQNFRIDFTSFLKLGFEYKYNFDDGIKDLIKLYSFYD